MNKQDKAKLLKDLSAGTASIDQVKQAHEVITGDKVVLSSFFDFMKFASSYKGEHDHRKVVISPSPFTQFLETII